MYRCKNCGCRFDEPKELNSSWEAYYGISGMFDYSTPRTAYVCPECNDDGIDCIQAFPIDLKTNEVLYDLLKEVLE